MTVQSITERQTYLHLPFNHLQRRPLRSLFLISNLPWTVPSNELKSIPLLYSSLRSTPLLVPLITVLVLRSEPYPESPELTLDGYVAFRDCSTSFPSPWRQRPSEVLNQTFGNSCPRCSGWYWSTCRPELDSYRGFSWCERERFGVSVLNMDVSALLLLLLPLPCTREDTVRFDLDRFSVLVVLRRVRPWVPNPSMRKYKSSDRGPSLRLRWLNRRGIAGASLSSSESKSKRDDGWRIGTAGRGLC